MNFFQKLKKTFIRFSIYSGLATFLLLVSAANELNWQWERFTKLGDARGLIFWGAFALLIFIICKVCNHFRNKE